MCLEVGSGSLLGLPGVITKEPYTLRAFIRKGSAVSFISREDFEQTVREEREAISGVVLLVTMEFARRCPTEWIEPFRVSTQPEQIDPATYLNKSARLL
jgi:hypothetical protein